jgi:hypothetical protein
MPGVSKFHAAPTILIIERLQLAGAMGLKRIHRRASW